MSTRPNAEVDSVAFDVPYKPCDDAVDVTPELDGGVKKEILVPGSGDEHPGIGDRVTVHYTGRLAMDGFPFDSSRDANRAPFEFNLGKGEVIKAWDLGVASMKLGEVARLTCRSDYAYGECGSPPRIPSCAVLVFDVELLSWNGEDLTGSGDGGILRTIINDTKTFTTPNHGATVEIHAVGKHEGRVFFDKEMGFRLDLGEASELPPGIEQALFKFRRAEKSRLKLSPSYGFGSAGNSEFRIPPHASLVYEIELREFKNAKDCWEMTHEEKMEHASQLKKLGTEHFQRGEFCAAASKYAKAAEYLDNEGTEPEEKRKRGDLLLAVTLNRALVAIKMNDPNSAVVECSKALAIDPRCEKALFRRGQALFAMHEPDRAAADFARARELNPENMATVQQISACAKASAEIKLRDKTLFKRMFQSLGFGEKA